MHLGYLVPGLWSNKQALQLRGRMPVAELRGGRIELNCGR